MNLNRSMTEIWKVNMSDLKDFKNLKAATVSGSTAPVQAPSSTESDNEIIANLDLLMNYDALEQADSWDEMVNLSSIEEIKNESGDEDSESDN